MAINMYEVFTNTTTVLTAEEKAEIKATVKIADCEIFSNKLSQLTTAQLTKLLTICEKVRLHFVDNYKMWLLWNNRCNAVQEALQDLQY